MGNIKIPADTCNQFLTKYIHVHKEIIEEEFSNYLVAMQNEDEA